MHYSRSSFRAEAGFFVGFLNRFNSSYKSDWIYQDWPYAHSGYWTPISDPWCMYFYRYKFQRRQWSHTSWVTVVTPIDRPKSVRNRCVIELFVAFVCVVTLPFWHFCWCRGFCHRTESDLFLFLLIHVVLGGQIKAIIWLKLFPTDQIQYGLET